jgi:gamma-D-glutamyl-L-lysine dipeptidyl-peptidase
LKFAYVNVNVATVWTKPNLQREIDYYATTNPTDLPAWLSGLTHPDRVWFIDENILQTQILYGSQVIVTEESGDWSHILIPDQWTPKNETGYPGWVPTRQLTFNEEYHQLYAQAPHTWVTVPPTSFMMENQLKLSYLTHLPFVETEEEQVWVKLPNGEQGVLTASDVTTREGEHNPYPLLEKQKGELILEAGKPFLDLPYLWSGMSSFGYDCSGFSRSMHLANGILIPRDASAQFKYGKEHGLEVQKEELLPGDLVYFANERGFVDHVGIYAGNGDFLHASNSNYVVKIQPLWEGKYLEKYCGAMRYW